MTCRIDDPEQRCAVGTDARPGPRRRSPRAVPPALVPLLALVLAGCAVESVQMRLPTLREADGAVWLNADAAASYRCEDGLLLACDTPQNRLSDRLCRCVR